MTCPAAHHPKADGPSRHDLQIRELTAAWRARWWAVRNGTFTPVDPITDRRERFNVRTRLAKRLWRATLVRDCMRAAARAAAKQKLRDSLRLVAGGRT